MALQETYLKRFQKSLPDRLSELTTIQRIWSTDWFRDPQGEVAIVLPRLDEVVVVVLPPRRIRSDARS
jgi:hypothetical protein